MKRIQDRGSWSGCLSALLSTAILLGALGQSVAGVGGAQASPTAGDVLREKWGIEITSLRLSAQGYFVDFRYKVIDAEKAAPLANKELRPYLVDVSTGKKLMVPTTPKLGSLRQTTEKLTPGRIYFMFFGNSRGIIKPGSKVTVVIGDFRLENQTIWGDEVPGATAAATTIGQDRQGGGASHAAPKAATGHLQPGETKAVANPAPKN